jgi:hypothetical protein
LIYPRHFLITIIAFIATNKSTVSRLSKSFYLAVDNHKEEIFGALAM